MTALVKDRATPARAPGIWEYPVGAGARLFAGALAALGADGDLYQGQAALGLTCVGRCVRPADNRTGASGAITSKVEPGIFGWANSAGPDLITPGMRGLSCFMVDDQTVAATSGGNTRSVAGVIIDVDATYVWVRSGLTGQQDY